MNSVKSHTETPERSRDRPSPFFEAAQVSSVGIEMAVSVLVGWGVGYWLDSKFETGPWLMLAGTILGVSAGFKGLLQTAQKVNKRQIAETEAITSKSGDSKTSNELSNSVTLTTREVL